MKRYISSRFPCGDYLITGINGWQFRLQRPMPGLTKDWELTYLDEPMNPRPVYNWDKHVWFERKADALIWVNNRIWETMKPAQ
jgi:hypothetical protein